MVLQKILFIINIIKGGVDMQIMIDVYSALIVAQSKTIDQVPSQLRQAVLANLNAMGLDGYGNPLTD